MTDFPDLTSRIPAVSIRRGPVHTGTKYKHPVAMFPRPCEVDPRTYTRPPLQERQAKPSQASRFHKESLRSRAQRDTRSFLSV